jgi:hypothetical protein
MFVVIIRVCVRFPGTGFAAERFARDALLGSFDKLRMTGVEGVMVKGALSVAGCWGTCRCGRWRCRCSPGRG